MAIMDRLAGHRKFKSYEIRCTFCLDIAKSVQVVLHTNKNREKRLNQKASKIQNIMLNVIYCTILYD